MKINIEQNIKESLHNHEMPYNASAWTAMQAKLDVVKPVSVAAPTSNLKWIIVAASVVVIGVVSYIAINPNTKSIEKETIQAQKNETIESSNSALDNTLSDESVEVNTPSTPLEKNTNASNSTPLTPNNSTNKTTSNGNELSVNTNNTNSSNTTISNKANEINKTVINNTNSGNNSNTTPTAKNYILPKINDICEGEVVTVKNTNDVSIVIEGPGLHFIVPANSERKVRMTGNGNHEISIISDEKSNETTSFNVKSAPNADFLIDTDTKFEKGLPTTKLETNSIGVDYTWIVGKTRIHGEKVNTHFYKPGSHNVTLVVKDANGCSTSTTKAIQIDEKYNLMAVNSFIPDDTDIRNNTFMPFALTQRDVKFHLIIIDPTDGHIVFQSKDASNAWDGIDRTDGSPVNYGTTYIWKVTIENAEPNESSEYAGNITPIRKR